jgi:hypothetical protein
MGWIAHTVVDGALAVGLLIAGIHGNGADYLVLDAAGGYLLLATLVTDAPGGIWKAVPRLVHRIVDGAVALGLFASPFIVWKYHAHIDPFATAMAEAVGVILLRDAAVSEHRQIRPRLLGRAARQPGHLGGGGLRRGGAAPIDARAFEAGVHDAARRAGTVTGKVATKTAAARARRRAARG